LRNRRGQIITLGIGYGFTVVFCHGIVVVE
jgi:hypothetical protein